LQEDIEERMESIFAGMLWEGVERETSNPEYLCYLRGEADTEVAIADANLHTAKENMLEAATHHDQIAELRQRFERGDVQPTHYVDAVDLLHCAVSPDADNVPDEKLDSGDAMGWSRKLKYVPIPVRVYPDSEHGMQPRVLAGPGRIQEPIGTDHQYETIQTT
jgi:hypothetical protein